MAAAKKKAKPSPKKKAPARKPAISRKAPPRGKKPAVKKPAAKKPAAKRAAPQKKPPAAALPAVPVAAPRPPATPKPAPAAAPGRGPLPGEEPIGVVTHYYNHLSVAVVRLDTGSLAVGDTVRFLGHTTDFRQRIDSLQIEHETVTEVGRRQAFGVKVKEPAREHDVVYKVAAP